MSESDSEDGEAGFMGWGKRAVLALALATLAALVALPLAGRAASSTSEPNDDIPGVAIPSTQPVIGDVRAGTSDADDVYAVRIPAGSWFWARLSAPTGTDLDLYLFGATARSVRSTTPAVAFSERPGSSVEFIRYRASIDTTAFVDVAAFRDEADYSLRYGFPNEEIAVSVRASSRCAWGSSTVVSGSLTRSLEATGAPGEYVYLFHRPYGASGFTTYAKTQTASDGTYAFQVRPTKRTTYQVRHLGSARYVAPSDPAGKTITPYAYLTTPSVPSALQRNKAFTASGYLKPRHTPGAKSVQVRCYLLQPDGTYVLKSTVMATNFDRATDAGTVTRYQATLSVPTAGRWKFKAYITGDSAHASTWSPDSRYRTVP